MAAHEGTGWGNQRVTPDERLQGRGNPVSVLKLIDSGSSPASWQSLYA